jgi:hypothetical protein
LRVYYPPVESSDFVSLISRSFRNHFPQTSDILEVWFDRSAENCDHFVNISEIDKYSITCTVCGSFEAGCSSSEGPSIVRLLEATRVHDIGHRAID